MKREGNIWPKIINFTSLLLAAKKAQRGKRYRPEVAAFNFNLEYELCKLQEELSTKSYKPGLYRSFQIYEPKERQISAAPYRDRVVHHTLVQALEPIFEKVFIFDSYACRRGKGTHAAVTRCQYFTRRYKYVLKADIQKFFPSMDHEILKALIVRKIKDQELQWLINLIIDNSNKQEEVCNYFPKDDLFTPIQPRIGIPIGNQTSQFFSNVYLNPLDHFVKDNLGIKGYIRYVDDFLVFSDSKQHLTEVREQIKEILVPLRLRLHPKKSTISLVKNGIRFLGYRVFPDYKLLPKDNVRRFLRRVRKMQEEYANHQISFKNVHQRLMSWVGHAINANTYKLRERLFGRIAFKRAVKN